MIICKRKRMWLTPTPNIVGQQLQSSGRTGFWQKGSKQLNYGLYVTTANFKILALEIITHLHMISGEKIRSSTSKFLGEEERNTENLLNIAKQKRKKMKKKILLPPPPTKKKKGNKHIKHKYYNICECIKFLYKETDWNRSKHLPSYCS